MLDNNNNSSAVKNAQIYLSQEPNQDFRRETELLLEKINHGSDTEMLEARNELSDRFGGHLKFGTAGLRGKVEAGFRRLNKVTVAQAAWATSQYLLSEQRTGTIRPSSDGVVIGFDGRLNSREFAELVASILTAHAIPVKIFSEAVPTPICAFAVTNQSAAAAIVVTASHNPPQDNGIKIYWHQGAQINVPHTTHIVDLIERAPAFTDIERLSIAEQGQRSLRIDMGAEIFDAYFAELARSRFHDNSLLKTSLKIVYTPMHGVGGKFVLRGLKEAGFSDISVVAEQFAADGHFPTVPFPNPEEEGALDLAVALATRINADIILASDPDADRLAVWIKRNDVWASLSGNEVGWLLGEDALASSHDENKLAISTVVSSRMLERITSHHKAQFLQTMTGFSHIAALALKRKEECNEHFVFGYEEALGYCIGSAVKDKDGVSAAVRCAELVVSLARKNSSIQDELNRLSLMHGLHETMQWSVRLDGSTALQQMKDLMSRFRAGTLLDSLFDLHPLKEAHDFMNDSEPNEKTDMLIYTFLDQTQLIVRPSGTETKIKFYLEGVANILHKDALETGRQQLKNTLVTMKNYITATINNAH